MADQPAEDALALKLERLLRFHRQRVFDERTGDLHASAVRRLKRTATFRRVNETRQSALEHRRGQTMLNTYA